MKTIGLIGGTGWQSTGEYYRIINLETNKRRGYLNFATCIIYSLDYGEIDAFNKSNDRSGVYSLLRAATDKLIAGGAECLVLCANTLHQFADDIEKDCGIPLIHIASATAREIHKQGLQKVGLLGN